MAQLPIETQLLDQAGVKLEGVPTREILGLSVVAEPIEVTSNSPRPDPDWNFTDREGHYHYWSKDGGYNTLQWTISDPCPQCGYEDGSGYRCIDCGEEITPATLPGDPYRRFIPGPRTVTITLVPDTINHIPRRIPGTFMGESGEWVLLMGDSTGRLYEYVPQS